MQQGLFYHKNAKFIEAETCYQKSLQAQPDNHETLQLLGALMHKLGKSKQAIPYLKKSLSISPKQAHVLNTLGNVYKLNEQYKLATKQYRLSIEMMPDYVDPYLNFGNMLLQQQRIKELQALLIKGQPYLNDNWRFERLKASLAKYQDKFSDAIQILIHANHLAPNQVPVLHDLGLVYRLNGQTKLAVECYQKVEQLGHKSEAFFHNYANALSDSSASSNALEYYSKALNINLFARETLLNWCDLMWESGQPEFMFSAYEKATSSADAPVEIYMDYIGKLLRVKHVELAQGVLQNMQNLHSQSPYFHAADILIKRALKNYSVNELDLSSIFEDNQLELNYKLDIIEYLLEAGTIKLAYQELMALLPKHPKDQLLLALLQTCSRLLPKRTYPFEQIERYLFEYQIAPPKGVSLQQYLSALKEVLLTLHTSKEQPLEQTLHKGTQTRGKLFGSMDPLLIHMESQYRLAVKEYIKQRSHLPPLYPDFWQQQSAIKFGGSWSVALKQSGYHNHHVHPMGWLSSVCYISLPTISDDNNQGYLQVGVPNLANAGLALTPLKEVKPTVGKLVLFPSMLWHGTVPFEEDNMRLSIACDIVYADSPDPT